jgi:hypothetical protein
MDLIIPFNCQSGLRQKSYQMPFVILGRLLRNYCSSGKIQAISLYAERMRVFWEGKDWSGSDLFLEDNESGLFIKIPFPNNIFFGKVKEGLSRMGEILDKPLIEVGKA